MLPGGFLINIKKITKKYPYPRHMKQVEDLCLPCRLSIFIQDMLCISKYYKKYICLYGGI